MGDNGRVLCVGVGESLKGRRSLLKASRAQGSGGYAQSRVRYCTLVYPCKDENGDVVSYGKLQAAEEDLAMTEDQECALF